MVFKTNFWFLKPISDNKNQFLVFKTKSWFLKPISKTETLMAQGFEGCKMPLRKKKEEKKKERDFSIYKILQKKS